MLHPHPSYQVVDELISFIPNSLSAPPTFLYKDDQEVTTSPTFSFFKRRASLFPLTRTDTHTHTETNQKDSEADQLIYTVFRPVLTEQGAELLRLEGRALNRVKVMTKPQKDTKHVLLLSSE